MSRGCIDYATARGQLAHGFPFTCNLAAGDRPTQVLDKNRRVVFSVSPLYEELAERLTLDMNVEAARNLDGA